jgi:hypothetical protein
MIELQFKSDRTYGTTQCKIVQSVIRRCQEIRDELEGNGKAKVVA